MQKSLKNAVQCSGVGVHSGLVAHLTIKPAPVDTGIVFIRTDITDKDNHIPAKWDNVVDTRMCTVIANKSGVTIGTIEHVMSALFSCGVDNAFVEIDGAEVPIMDGSAEPFVLMIEGTELVAQNKAQKVIRLKREISVNDGDKIVTLSPSDAPYFSFEINFDSKIIGTQKYDITLSPESFKSEISRARTFGFAHEVEALQKMGLARGGSLDNAIVIDGDTMLNKDELRYKNEFVRHKILDAIGDLYLAGMPIMAHYQGIRAGHDMNNKILHALFNNPDSYEVVDRNATKIPKSIAVLERKNSEQPSVLA